MRELEVLARNEQQALDKAAKQLEIESKYFEILEIYEPDELDLKQFTEEEGLTEEPQTDDVSLYLVRLGYPFYMEEAEKWTQGLIEKFAPGSKASAKRFENIIIIRLDVPETSILIGKKGATLDALQHVVVRALVTVDEHYPDVMLDVEGYRERKLVRLQKEASQAVDRALRSGRRVPLAPMSPAERKFIHNLVKDTAGVRTESRGQDRARHVVIEPTNPAPQQSRGGGGNRGGYGGQGGGNRDRGDQNKGGNRQHAGQQQARGQQGGGKQRGGPGITDDMRSRLYGEMRDEEIHQSILKPPPGQEKLIDESSFNKSLIDDDEDDGQLKFIDQIE